MVKSFRKRCVLIRLVAHSGVPLRLVLNLKNFILGSGSLDLGSGP